MNFILQLVNKIWYYLSHTCCWLQDFSPQLVASPWHSYPFSTFRRIRNFFILELFLSLLMFLLPKKKRKYSTRKSVKGGWNLIRCGLCRVLEIENIWIDNVICWLISSMKFPGWISWWTSVGFLESRPKYFLGGHFSSGIIFFILHFQDGKKFCVSSFHQVEMVSLSDGISLNFFSLDLIILYFSYDLY